MSSKTPDLTANSSGLPSRRLGALGPAFAVLRRGAPAFAFRCAPKRRLERVTRLELATSSLARRCSTTELHPQPKLADSNNVQWPGARKALFSPLVIVLVIELHSWLPTL